MKPMAVLVGVLGISVWASVVLAQDNPCEAGGKMYDHGAVVCMRGFVQQCVNGSWSNQQRFCSDDPQLEVIREPEVAQPPVTDGGGPSAPAVNPPSAVEVPSAEE
jgi:hypothetical protein